MPIYRVDRTFDARDILASSVMERDNKLEKCLRGRLRHTVKAIWMVGGTSGFIFSSRAISRDLMKDGYDGYTFHLLTGDEAEKYTRILGLPTRSYE